MSKDDVTLVYTASGEIEAQQVKAFLEANGIPSIFVGESLRMTHGLTLDGLGRVDIHVPGQHVERARDLLSRVDAGEFALDENDEPD